MHTGDFENRIWESVGTNRAIASFFDSTGLSAWFSAYLQDADQKVLGISSIEDRATRLQAILGAVYLDRGDEALRHVMGRLGILNEYRNVSRKHGPTKAPREPHVSKVSFADTEPEHPQYVVETSRKESVSSQALQNHVPTRDLADAIPLGSEVPSQMHVIPTEPQHFTTKLEGPRDEQSQTSVL